MADWVMDYAVHFALDAVWVFFAGLAGLVSCVLLKPRPLSLRALAFVGGAALFVAVVYREHWASWMAAVLAFGIVAVLDTVEKRNPKRDATA